MFTVMTWNVENPFEPVLSAQADFDTKLDALAGLRDPTSRLGNGWTGALSRHFRQA
jgi:hypothetical protein